MTTPSIDFRALAARPRPVVRLEDPWAYYVDDNDPLRKETRRAASDAGHEYAMLAAGKAAEMVRRVMPAAHLVVFDRSEDAENGVSVELVAIRDASGDLIWHDEPYDEHPDAVARCNAEAHGGPVRAVFDSDTRNAIEALIADAEDWGRGYYCRSELPYETYEGDPRRFEVDDEIEWATKRRHAARSDRFWRRLRNYAAALVRYTAHH